MYYDHFGLKQAPFKITPNTDFFFAGANRGAILGALVYAINNGEGIVKVVGEVGSGKTMLSRVLQTRLPEKVECVYLANPSMSPEDVVFAIAFELQIKLPKNADRLQAMQLLQKYLLDRHAEGKQVVIFVEEAQGMPIATLEEIRLLTNLETKQDKLLQIVLFGQPELDENLNAPQIRQLRERITHSFYLNPIDQNAIRDYVMFRLRSAGYFGPPLFTDAAIKLLNKASRGLVRRVNILADKAMLATYSQNLYLVDVKQVEAAIRDSEFGGELAKQKKKRNIVLSILVFSLLCLLIGVSTKQGFWQRSATPASTNPKTAEPKAGLEATPATPTPLSQEMSVATANTTEGKPANPAPESPQATVVQPATQTENESKATEIKTTKITEAKNTTNNTNTAKLSQPPAVTETSTATNQETTSSATAEIANISGGTLQQRLEVTEVWLKQQSENTVSVQLMGSSNESQLMRHLNYLATRLNVENIYAYRTQVNKKPFITILYGSYASRKDAAAAIAQLPEDIKANQPQVRTIGGILKETNQFP